MKSRAKLLLTCATCAVVIGAGPHTAKGADVWTKGAPPLDNTWWFHGEIDVGGRFFLNNPQRDGVASQGGKSLAKYYEYSTIKPGPFSDIWLSTGSRDGLYQIDIGGKNIGYSDQNYYLDASKAGQQYFNFSWDQTPHVYSTSAQTFYNGVGTTSLTIPPGLGTALFGASGGTNNVTAAKAANVQAIINANVHQTDIGIRRDTASVDYRWTPTDAWDIRANYSDMHRTGTQVDGVVMSPGTGSVRVDAIKPVDDTTQNFGLNGEYAGTSPWNKKFNFKIAYNGSVYNDANTAYTVQNPFCQDSGPLPHLCQQGATQQGTSNTSSWFFNQMSLWPDNQANGVTATLGADLPATSRYMGTASFTNMRQNQAFLPFTINPGTGFTINGQNPASLLALPASSLNGSVNTLLLNNVLTTQITPELKSKLSYRYYDYDNNTPQIFESNWVLTDYRLAGGPSPPGRSADYAPVVGVQQSYTRQNAGAELDWRPDRYWNLGTAFGYEHYNWYRADVDHTNEFSGKVFGDWKPASWFTLRASYLYSERRFGTYDNYDFLSHPMFPNDPPLVAVMQNQNYRQMMFSDRDRQLAKLSASVDVTNNLNITPTAGLQYDNYLNNVNLGSLTTSCGAPGNINCIGAGTYNGVPLNGTQPGLKHNNAWNWGLEGTYVVNPDTTFMLSYTREYRNQEILWCGDAAPSGTNGGVGACNAFSGSTTNGTGFPSGSNDSTMKDTVDTFIVRLRYGAIPNKLDFDVGYTLSIADSSTSINPGPFPSLSNGGAGVVPAKGVVTVAGGPFPDVKTTFQRFDVIARYKIDDTLVHQLGFRGDVMLKLRYAYETNRVTNWQNDPMQTYMWSVNNQTVGYMTWLAFDNPNYDAHLFGA
ncbi:MAG: MtrB/PioB family decaheme-associated outer membrane protein, partial [Limisphaerales bacterium]